MFKQEVLVRGKRLINNFCSYTNKIYLIKLKDIRNIKASFGDVNGLRDGTVSLEEAQRIIKICQLSLNGYLHLELILV